MSQTQTVPKTKKHLLREEEADRDLRHTEYSRFVPIFLTLILLATLFPVSLAQFVTDRAEHKTGTPVLRGLARLLRPRREHILPPPEDIRGFEKDLDERSVITAAFLPSTQLALTSLGTGNEQVIPGIDGRLFFFVCYHYVTGGGFLNNADNASKLIGEITNVSQELAANGVKLILAPVPPSPVFYPESFAGHRFTSNDAPIQNESWDRFKTEMARNGVTMVDLTPTLLAVKRKGGNPWLTEDTHWTPEGMHAAAESIADTVKSSVDLPAIPDPGYYASRRDVTFEGDLCHLLHLTPHNARYPELTVHTEQVHARDGSLLHPDPRGDVLVMGDSLSDRFDEPSTGVSAGLPQHLSLLLRRPVDRLNDPDHGLVPIDYAVKYLSSHPERLVGKKVVVWEMNARLLAQPQYWGDVNLRIQLPKSAVQNGQTPSTVEGH